MRDHKLTAELRAFPLFKEFVDHEIDSFVDLLETETAAEGTRIVSQGSSGDSMYLLVRGEVDVLCSTGGKDLLLARLGPGDFFGELALIDPAPRFADVVAVSTCLLLRVPPSVIRALAGIYPGIGYKLLAAICRVLVRRARSCNRAQVDSLLPVFVTQGPS